MVDYRYETVLREKISVSREEHDCAWASRVHENQRSGRHRSQPEVDPPF